MLQLIKDIANDTGITAEEADRVFISILNSLVNKLPALQQVVEDIFDNAADDTFKIHVAELIISLQEQQRKETFGSWKIPQRREVTHREGNYPLF